MDNDRTRTRNLTWFAIGATTALVVAVLATRRGRHGVGDKMIDLGIWMQTDEGVRQVERSLNAWGRSERRERDRQKQRQNGRGRAADSDRP